MKNNIKIIFSDIDGTLLKADGKTLQKGVTVLFERINAKNIPVVFISGKNYEEINDFLKILKSQASITNFDPLIVSNSGSFMLNNQAEDKPLTKETIEKIREVIKKVDESALIVYKTKGINYIEKARDTKTIGIKIKKSFKKALKNFLVSVHKFDFPTITLNEENIEKLVNSNEIYSLNVLSFKAKEISNALDEYYKLGIKTCPNGVYVDVANTNKFEFIKSYLKNSRISWDEVAYLGDSKNDEEALLNCGVGILCNLKKKNHELFSKVISRPKKYAIYDLSNPEIVNCLTNEEYDEDKLKVINKGIDDLYNLSKATKKKEKARQL